MNAMASPISIEKDFEQSKQLILLYFLDSNLEGKYQGEKKKKNDAKVSVIIFCSIFSHIICSARTFQQYLKVRGDIEENYTPFLTEVFSSTLCFLIVLGIVLESFIYFFECLRYVRGFCITIPSMAFMTYYSYQTSININSSSYYFIPLAIPYLGNTFCITLIYTYNWINGAIINIICFIFLFIYIFYYNMNYFDQIIFFTSYMIICIIFIICLWILEYFQRHSFFISEIVLQQKQNLDKILNNLPVPIVIAEQGEICFANEGLFQDSEYNLNLHNRSTDDRSKGLNVVKIKKMLANFSCEKSGETLNNIISHSKMIKENSIFILTNSQSKRKIPFEIASTQVVSSGFNQIVYSLKNLFYYKKVQNNKSKEKYSRIFISSVTHNLRTPLNMIRGNANILENELTCNNSIYCKNIEKGCEMLNLLIENLLDYSQIMIGTFQINVNEFNFRESIKTIFNLFIDRFNDKEIYLNIEIDIQIPEKLISDEKRIIQIIRNLLDNAFKFTVKGGVTIFLNYLVETKMIEVCIIDTGIGIESGDLPKLFKPYGKLSDELNLNPNGNLNQVQAWIFLFLKRSLKN